jgi:hypothetical protein
MELVLGRKKREVKPFMRELSAKAGIQTGAGI